MVSKSAEFTGFIVHAFILLCSSNGDKPVFKIGLKFSFIVNFGRISFNLVTLHDQGRITLFVLLFKFSFLC